MTKKATIVVTKPPYGSAIMAEAFRAAMGIPSTNIDTNVVLEGDAIYALLKTSNPKEGLDFGHMGEAFMMYDEYGFNLFVHKPSVEARGIRCQDLMECQAIDDAGLEAMLRDSDAILRF